MQSKKNEKVDLTKNSSLYFVIGLATILFISWQAIEWKTYEKDLYGYEALNVEDEEEVEETVIESTETNEDEIVEIVEVEEEYDDVDVPFAVIEDVPIFPGCEKVSKSERRNCFQEKINKHIRKNFRYPEIAQEMGIQGRVYVNFIIAKDGQITNIRMRGPDKNLEKEAQRIIAKLPNMIPGKQRGRPVRVPFSIPITFRLQ
ncbi:energy transducer TonB [Flavobacteriaceae bacterium]|nr:energy transducer TonB [Flavobacteriaceae bacterium]